MKAPALHLVTDDAVLRAPDFPARAAAALRAGGAAVALHLRGHGLSGGALFALAERLSPVAAECGAALLVNDRLDVAMAAGARGVQLGRRSLPVPEARRLLGALAWIGRSVHALEEAREAEAAGADFLLFGTVFASASHPGTAPAGEGRLREVAASVRVPVIGIGGVTPERVGVVRAAGAWGVAVLGGVWHVEDSAEAVRRFRAALEQTG